MHYKWVTNPNRPRPSQLCPALLPPIDPPGHASYPSGHATETTLVYHILKDETNSVIEMEALLGR